VQPSRLRSKIEQEFDDIERHAVARFLVMVAAASEGICPAEEDGLKVVFRQALNFPETLVSEIAEKFGINLQSQFVTVQKATPCTGGERIPLVTPKLDFEMIKQIQAESQQSAKILIDMMGENIALEEADPVVQVSPQTSVIELEHDDTLVEPDPAQQLPTRPPANLSGFYEDICEKTHWTEQELTDLAKKHNTTHWAAINQINDWSYEMFEDPLIEHDDGNWEVNLGLLPE
jgi:TerB-like protein